MSNGTELWKSNVGISDAYANLRVSVYQIGNKITLEFLCDDGEWRGRVLALDKTEYERGDVPLEIAK